MQSTTETTPHYNQRSKTKSGPSVKLFLLVWILLIALGITATYLYSNHLKQDMLQQIQRETQKQMTLLKTDYEKQLGIISAEVGELDSKVQSFNELLTFTKDNATSKTDNSNKLYTQLSDVKNQLNKLQKKMDLLK